MELFLMYSRMISVSYWLHISVLKIGNIAMDLKNHVSGAFTTWSASIVLFDVVSQLKRRVR